MLFGRHDSIAIGRHGKSPTLWQYLTPAAPAPTLFLHVPRKLPHKPMNRAQFVQLIAHALDRLPDEFRAALDNVEIVVEHEPHPTLLHRMGLGPGETLLGLYEGIPLTERGHGYTFVPPDKITLFQGPIEREANNDPQAIATLVEDVLLHELAHYFGFDEAHIRRIEAERDHIRQQRNKGGSP